MNYDDLERLLASSDNQGVAFMYGMVAAEMKVREIPMFDLEKMTGSS